MSGRTNVSRKAFSGHIRREATEDSKEVHCFNANLSEQDLDRVGWLSGLATQYHQHTVVTEKGFAYKVSFSQFQASRRSHGPGVQA